MGDDQAALLRLWQEKRGEVEPRRPLRQSHCPARGGHRTRSTATGSNATPAGSSAISNSMCSIRSCAGWQPPSTEWSRPPGRCSRPSSCCRGRSRKKGRPKNICPSCSTICGSPTPSCRCSRSSPAAVNGSRSALRRIRSTSIFCSPQRKSSGAVSRVASPLASLALSRRGLGSRRCGSST